MWKYFAFCLIVFFLQISPIYAQYTCLPNGKYQDLPYWQADSVFTGTVEKKLVENSSDEKQENFTTDRPPQLINSVVKFSIEKKYRGITDKTIEINTTSSFKEGEKYFVYAVRGKDGKFYKLDDGFCGKPPILLDNASEDIEYAEDIASGNSGTRIYGWVYQDKQDSFKTPRQNVPIIEIEVTIKSETNSFTTKTDKKGKYTFKNIPVGEYKISASTPNGMREREINYSGLNRRKLIFIGQGYAPNQLILLKAKEKLTPFYYHSGSYNFFFTSLSSIEGKFIAHDGENPPQLFVHLLPIDENGKAILNDSITYQWTNPKSGEFYFDSVPEGRYVVAINRYNCHTNRNPEYRRNFYPGTFDINKARIITVYPKQDIELRDFRLSPPLKEKWVIGVVLSADKKPVANATVWMRDSSQKHFDECVSGNSISTQTDSNGRFKMKGFESYNYKISAYKEINKQNLRIYSEISELTLQEKSNGLTFILDQNY